MSPPFISLGLHLRHRSDGPLTQRLDSHDKSDFFGGEEEKEKREGEGEGDDEDFSPSPVLPLPPSESPLHPLNERRRDRNETEDSPPPPMKTPNSIRPLPPPPPPPPPPPSLPSHPPPPSHRSLTPVPVPHPPATPSPPPPPPSLPSSVPSPFALRHVSPSPRPPLPLSLRHQPSRERQRTIQHLLSQSNVTSISSPEYEFSVESSTRSQPSTPSHSRGGKAEGDGDRPELHFVKEIVEGPPPQRPPTSSLTSQIQRVHPPTPPIYRRQSSPPPLSHQGGRLKLTVHLPIEELFIQLEVRASTTSEGLIRLVLAIYRREYSTNLHPLMLDSVRLYQLFIAEEGGRADEDFPGLDPHAVVGTTAASHFALKHLESGSRPRRSPTLSGDPRRTVSGNSGTSVSDITVSGVRERGGGKEGEEGVREVEGRTFNGAMEGRRVTAPFNLESSGSQDSLVRVSHWYSALLCCARVEEDGGALSGAERRSRGDSKAAMTAGNVTFASPEAGGRQ